MYVSYPNCYKAASSVSSVLYVSSEEAPQSSIGSSNKKNRSHSLSLPYIKMLCFLQTNYSMANSNYCLESSLKPFIMGQVTENASISGTMWLLYSWHYKWYVAENVTDVLARTLWLV